MKVQEHGGTATSDRGQAAAGRGGAAASQAPPASIGPWLKGHRERLGLSAQDVADALKVRRFYIEALEAEAFAYLPSRTYAAGYVRSIAQGMGLDANEAAARLRSAWPEERAPAAPARPLREPTADRRFPVSMALSLAITVAIAAYAYWYVTTSAEMGRPVLSPVAEFEEEAPTPVPAPPEPVPGPLQLLGVPELARSKDAADALRSDGGQRAADAAAQPLPAAHLPRPRPETAAAEVFAATYRLPVYVAVERPALAEAEPSRPPSELLPESSTLAAYLPAVQLRADLGPLRTGTQAPMAMHAAKRVRAIAEDETVPMAIGRTQAFAAVPPADQAGPSPDVRDGGRAATASQAGQPAADGLSGIRVVADQACWIEVRAASGKAVIQQLLQPGDQLDLPRQEGLTLTAGNAGGIRILVGGTAVPALGAQGEVVRDVPLNPAALLAYR